jgi:hypothetical protein
MPVNEARRCRSHAFLTLGFFMMVASRTETYVVSNLGSCLFLKLCGFVEESRAEIRDVSETRLKLRLGGSWLRQLLGARTKQYPLDLEILFEQAAEEDDHRPQACVQVIVQDAHLISHQSRFDIAARQVLWQLRSYLMV